MALVVNTNTASLNAQRRLMGTTRNLGKNFERLSSGLRINSAADDAAGLAISESMRSEIAGLNQAQRNANDAISLLQTADGAFEEISNMVIRMRTLTTQAANGTLNDDQRGYLDEEYQALILEIDRIADSTEFNGDLLLDGGFAAVNMQVGGSVGDTIGVTIDDAASATLFGAAAVDIGTLATTLVEIPKLDTALDNIATARAEIGALQNRFESTVNNIATAAENLSAANSRIRDVDVASETADLTKNNILMQAGTSVLAQANQLPSLALSLLG